MRLMRLRPFVVSILVVSIAVAIVVLPADAALAGGWDTIEFPRDAYVVGQVASARSEFFADRLKGTGSLDGGPYFAYLLPTSRWIDPPTIPAGAIRIGVLGIEGPVVRDGYRYGVGSLSFTVPDVPSGRYTIGFCDDPCDHSTVGWLGAGFITVVHTPYEGTLLKRIDRLQQRRWKLREDVRRAERRMKTLRDTLRGTQAVLRAAANADGPAVAQPAPTSTPDGSAVGWWAALASGMIGIGVGMALRRRRRVSTRLAPPMEPAASMERDDREREPAGV